MAEKKHIPFLVLELLQRYSDEEHPLRAQDLLALLENEKGIKIERRTLYSNIDILMQAGYEISDYSDNGKGYYLMRRTFEKSEILMLCNVIHASHFISEKQSSDLIRRLLSTMSTYQQKEYLDAVYLPNRQKTPSKSLFYNIEQISEAIRDHKCIEFTYTRFDKNKKLVPRRAKPYTVEPRYIVYSNSRPYLICTSLNHPDFAHYRIDRIVNIKKLDSDVSRMAREYKEAYEYASDKLFMYAGDTERISIRCDQRIMDQMIDIFGPQLRILEADNGSFTAVIHTTAEGALFLAQQFMDGLEIIEPQEIRQLMHERLLETAARYEEAVR